MHVRKRTTTLAVMRVQHDVRVLLLFLQQVIGSTSFGFIIAMVTVIVETMDPQVLSYTLLCAVETYTWITVRRIYSTQRSLWNTTNSYFYISFRDSKPKRTPGLHAVVSHCSNVALIMRSCLRKSPPSVSIGLVA